MTVAQICTLLAEAGACAGGVCAAAPLPQPERQRFSDWLERGCHGSMDYLSRNRDCAFDPSTLLEGVRAIICAAYAYSPANDSDRHPLFADYARGADYHKALVKRLRPVARHLESLAPGSRTRICVDTAPLRERYWAQAAGLGHSGLNGQLIVPSVGCGVFLAEILWTEAVDGAVQVGQTPAKSSCIECGACVRACPAGALDGRGGLDARRCLSYLTIEHRGDLPEGLSLSKRIYGCDICRDVCPENIQTEPLPEFRLRPQLKEVTTQTLLQMTEADYTGITSGSAIRRASLSQLKRNIAKR